MGKICSNCGKELSDNAKFCGKCGTPIKMDIPDLKQNNKKGKDIIEKGVTQTREVITKGIEIGKNKFHSQENGVEQGEGKNIKNVVKIVSGILVLMLFFNIFLNPKESPEAAVALQVAKNDMGSGFSESAVSFKVVDTKKDSKFIIKCKAISDEAKEMYDLVYDTNICYYGVEFGNGAGEYFTTIGKSKSEVKDKMDW